MSGVAVVTGAAGAIGAAVCSRLRDAGHIVVGLDLAEAWAAAADRDCGEHAAAAQNACQAEPGEHNEGARQAEAGEHGEGAVQVEHFTCDVADEASVAAAFATVRDRHGHPTVLVNNAGVTGAGGIEEERPDTWRRILDVNLTGAYLCAREVVAGMRAAGGGRIINIASVNARFGGSALSGPAYAASKGGLLTFTRFLARHHADDRITANAVAPGPHETPMWHALDPALRERILATVPGDAPGDPADLAAVVEFLCGPHAGYITGATIDVNGGQWTG